MFEGRIAPALIEEDRPEQEWPPAHVDAALSRRRLDAHRGR